MQCKLCLHAVTTIVIVCNEHGKNWYRHLLCHIETPEEFRNVLVAALPRQTSGAHDAVAIYFIVLWTVNKQNRFDHTPMTHFAKLQIVQMHSMHVLLMKNTIYGMQNLNTRNVCPFLHSKFKSTENVKILNQHNDNSLDRHFHRKCSPNKHNSLVFRLCSERYSFQRVTNWSTNIFKNHRGCKGNVTKCSSTLSTKKSGFEYETRSKHLFFIPIQI